MSLETFKKKLEELEGEYTFDFANEDDCAYFLEEYGGEDHLKKKYPTLYSYFSKTRKNMSVMRIKNEEDKMDTTGKIGKLKIKPLNQSSNLGNNFGVLSAPIHFSFVDVKKTVYSKEPADEWKGVTIKTRIMDKLSKQTIISYSKVIPSTNKYVGNVQSKPQKCSSLDNREYKITIDFIGINPEGDLVRKIRNSKQNVGNVEVYTISNIIVDDPAPKSPEHWNNSEIVMLYGRINELEKYKNADYSGGDYYSNAFHDNIVHLLMPIKGKLVLNYNVEPVRLLEPSVLAGFTRSTATYDYKEQVFTYRRDITDDNQLYTKLKDRFIPSTFSPGVMSTVDFDVYINEEGRSKYDWHDDVSGLQDAEPKVIMLNGSFTYLVKNQLGTEVEEQFDIQSVTKEDLKELNREYYQYEEGTNVVYIPPITVYWGCFGKDVKITLADNTQKPASEIKAGDRLLGYGSQILTVENVVTGVDHTIYEIHTKEHGGIQVSGGHPMMCDGKCIKAAYLKSGDKLNLADGSLAEIISVEIAPYDEKVYNFTFEGQDDGVYLIANGFYSGDLKMQNHKEEKKERVFTQEEKDFVQEMNQLIVEEEI